MHNTEVDHHWKQQYNTCQPCHIKYDAIGFYETLYDDARYILRKNFAEAYVNLVPRSKDTKRSSSNNWLKLYDNVPVDAIRDLLDIYERDYKVFGYQIPKEILNRLRQ